MQNQQPNLKAVAEGLKQLAVILEESAPKQQVPCVELGSDELQIMGAIASGEISRVFIIWPSDNGKGLQWCGINSSLYEQMGMCRSFVLHQETRLLGGVGVE